jgi:hypothetical protein
MLSGDVEQYDYAATPVLARAQGKTRSQLSNEEKVTVAAQGK